MKKAIESFNLKSISQLKFTSDRMPWYIERYPGIKKRSDGHYYYRNRRIFMRDDTKAKQSFLKSVYSKTPKSIGRDKFFDIVLSDAIGIKRDDAFEWLKQQENYQRFRYRFQMSKAKQQSSKKPHSRWVMDTTQMRRIDGKKYSSGYKALLNVIDAFSKYAWSKPIKSMTPEAVSTAFKDIVTSVGQNPKTIVIDNGTEFKGVFQQLCDRRSIKVIRGESFTPQNQGLVERFHRTLKRWIKSEMVDHNDNRFQRYIDKSLKAYNHTRQDTTGKKPVDMLHTQKDHLSEKTQERINRRKKYTSINNRYFKPLQVGDKVRIDMLKTKHVSNAQKSLAKQKTLRMDRPIFTKEIYRVLSKIQGNYYTTSYNPNKKFYRHSLLKIDGSSDFQDDQTDHNSTPHSNNHTTSNDHTLSDVNSTRPSISTNNNNSNATNKRKRQTPRGNTTSTRRLRPPRV